MTNGEILKTKKEWTVEFQGEMKIVAASEDEAYNLFKEQYPHLELRYIYDVFEDSDDTK